MNKPNIFGRKVKESGRNSGRLNPGNSSNPEAKKPWLHLKRVNPLKLILLLGLFVGSLDICVAFVEYYLATGKGPEGVLRFIASGVFGDKAYNKNIEMIVWGLLFHFIIAYSFTSFFYFLYTKMKWMSMQIIMTSILYGLFIWLVMRLIVLPMSNIPKHPINAAKAVKDSLILVCTFGLPLSLFMKNYSKASKQEKLIEKSGVRKGS